MKSYTKELWFDIPTRRAFVNITPQVEAALRESGIREGLCLVNAMHITASVFINDDEPGLHRDFERWLETLAPEKPYTRYDHNLSGEDNGDAHCKRQLFGREVVCAVTDGRLDFGPWEAKRAAVTDWLEAHRSYLGQMDLNVKSPKVLEYYRETLQKLADYGVSVVRLDAFAYASKEPGRHNFLNEPETWDLLAQVEGMAAPLGLTLLPEIHAGYGEGTYALLAEKGYPVYDFFLPGLIIDAFERRSGEMLRKWGEEIVAKGIATVNMLGCHDGIPLLDLKGLLPEEDIQRLIDTVVARGGFVKDLHGAKNVYYQVNATYFSALGEREDRLLLARALQLFMPGKPQVWYLDLFAGVNDHEAMRRAGTGGHKEINRTNLSAEKVEEGLKRDVVKDQLTLLRLRNTCPVFAGDARIAFDTAGSRLTIAWENPSGRAELAADLADASFTVTAAEASGRETFRMAKGRK